MRLKVIKETKAALSQRLQAFSATDISDRIVEPCALLPGEPLKRRIARRVARTALLLQQPIIRRRLNAPVGFACDLLAIEDRFANDTALAMLLKRTRLEQLERVLVPGCFLASEDVQFWLRRGVRQLDGFDVYSLQRRWDSILPQLRRHFGAEISFCQGSIESIPFPSGSFDLVATNAVLEHVRNLTAMVDETARVLRRGGWAWHCFGPLYYSFGADHCIAAYGDDAGYDHLLLDEEDYEQRIRNQRFFDTQPNPNLPFWALNQQFSFATASEYLRQFARRFHRELIVVKVSARGLAYRRDHPSNWSLLLGAGIAECDLLIKGLAVVLRKK
jgi:SAM-dependent methyltransferase